MGSSTLFLITLVLVFILYLQHYLKHNNIFRIVQADLSKLNPDVLSERFPVVVSDRLVSPDALLGTLFKYTYLTKTTCSIPPTPLVRLCASKHTILYCNTSDMDIDLLLPSTRKDNTFATMRGCPGLPTAQQTLESSGAQYITIRLKKQQVLIIPTFWSYHSQTPHTAICLDDPMSFIVRTAMGMRLF